MPAATRLLLTCMIGIITNGEAKACEGENLPSDATLRIGVKYKPDDCVRKAKNGDKLSMHYTGRLYSDCTVFDSSVERGEPFDFKLGQGQVIAGWDQGLRGMCVGEKRKLTIPSALGYGETGSEPKIPGGATLQFDVELLGIKEVKKKKKKSKAKKTVKTEL